MHARALVPHNVFLSFSCFYWPAGDMRSRIDGQLRGSLGVFLHVHIGDDENARARDRARGSIEDIFLLLFQSAIKLQRMSIAR